MYKIHILLKFRMMCINEQKLYEYYKMYHKIYHHFYMLGEAFSVNYKYFMSLE